MIRPQLTRQQDRVYGYLRNYPGGTHLAPSLRDIAVALNLASLATVHKHVEHLIAKGYVTREKFSQRSLRVVLLDGYFPTCGRDRQAEPV